jgi:aminotransferase
MMSTMMAIVDPGDEVIIFEPYYENYGPDAILSGATPKFVQLRPPQSAEGDWSFDADELARAFSNRTRAIIINTPNNPTGKVFTRQELQEIAALCQKWDVIAVTDEIYDHILYDGEAHVAMASLDGMQERTVTINSVSKTFSVTGWRVGWTVAPADLTNGIRKVHDFTVGAAAPLQAASGGAGVAGHALSRPGRDVQPSPRSTDADLSTRASSARNRAARYIMTDVAGWFPMTPRSRGIW